MSSSNSIVYGTKVENGIKERKRQIRDHSNSLAI
jgi:hypothetical protein